MEGCIGLTLFKCEKISAGILFSQEKKQGTKRKGDAEGCPDLGHHQDAIFLDFGITGS
jgi:hypothetical protein